MDKGDSAIVLLAVPGTENQSEISPCRNLTPSDY